ncbi:hypothetical protein FA15DRAFT_607276, partial [Coprinopsis marcescibilis]
LRSGKKVIPGDAWPMFCFKNYVYNDENPYEGLLKSNLLVTARPVLSVCKYSWLKWSDSSGILSNLLRCQFEQG